MHKRHPVKGGAVLLGGEQGSPTKKTHSNQLIDELTDYRALTLIARYQLSPELATMLAALAFGRAGV